jgi:hypothetical protein
VFQDPVPEKSELLDTIAENRPPLPLRHSHSAMG